LGTVPQYVTASVAIAAPSPGNMLTPANGGFIFGGNTAFTWTPGVGATQYVLTVTPANAQSTSITVSPSSQPGATVALPTANQSVTATLLTYTPNGPLQSQTYTYIINPSPGSQLPLLNTALQQPAPYVPNNGVESQPYTYFFTGGDARAMGEGECVETDVAVRIVLLTQTTATLAFTGANGIRPQASALTCTCPGGGVPINPAPVPVDTTPEITGVTSPIQANLNQTIHITGIYFGDPASGANDTVQICQNGGGPCTSVAADLLDDADILATVALSAGDYTVYVFSNGAAGSGFVAAPGSIGESSGADLEVEAASSDPFPVITANVLNNDNPLGPSIFQDATSTPIVYGGSQSSTSDGLLLKVSNPVAGASYAWGVTGPGSGSYAAPAASGAPVVWGIQRILPNAGVLNFTATAQYADGTQATASIPVEVGIRTDDVIVVGWINPVGVPSPNPSQASAFSVLNGMLPSGGTNAPFCNGEIGTLSQNGLLDPISNIGLTPGDRIYILDWMFKFAGNADPAQIPGGAFLDSTGVAADPNKVSEFTGVRTNYKLVNRFQVKMRVTTPQSGAPYFTAAPTVLQGQNMQLIGTTVNPCGAVVGQFLGLFPGQSGPRNGLQVSSPATGAPQFNSSISIINDGSHDANAIEAFNTLASLGATAPVLAALGTTAPVFWESIGSRITFSAAGGTTPITSPQVTVQAYPTYYVYVNGKQTTTYPEASNPTSQFEPKPYPFGTVSCPRLFGIVPGGRCGDAVSQPDPTALIPPTFCITGSNGSCNEEEHL